LCDREILSEAPEGAQWKDLLKLAETCESRIRPPIPR
jgi:hypothetical protein